MTIDLRAPMIDVCVQMLGQPVLLATHVIWLFKRWYRGRWPVTLLEQVRMILMRLNARYDCELLVLGAIVNITKLPEAVNVGAWRPFVHLPDTAKEKQDRVFCRVNNFAEYTVVVSLMHNSLFDRGDDLAS